VKIGVDIDGVLTDVEGFGMDYLCKYCVENNLEYTIDEGCYYYPKAFGISQEHNDEFWKKHIEFYSINERARTFSAEVLKKLREDGHEIYIVTARWDANRDDEIGENMRRLVIEWLLKNDIVYDKLIFSKATYERKHQEVIDEKIDLMIEDNPNNINELSELVPVICYDANYNKSCTGERITRCYSWYDIYSKIKKM
jgi:uncharacterized HAD superfamily protein